MSLNQFTISSAGSTSAQLDSVTVIDGTSSLRMRAQSADAIVAGLTTGAAITTGRIRSIARSGGASLASIGLFGMMQSSIDLLSNAYWVSVNPASDTTIIRLMKGAAHNLDQAAGGANVLASGALGFTWSTGNNYALQLKFQQDNATGQVRLEAWSGTATDYSNLALRLVYDDGVSPLGPSGVSMGVGIDSVSSTLKDVWFDKTKFYGV